MGRHVFDGTPEVPEGAEDALDVKLAGKPVPCLQVVVVLTIITYAAAVLLAKLK